MRKKSTREKLLLLSWAMMILSCFSVKAENHHKDHTETHCAHTIEIRHGNGQKGLFRAISEYGQLYLIDSRGYSLLNINGYLQYAAKANGRLIPSGQKYDNGLPPIGINKHLSPDPREIDIQEKQFKIEQDKIGDPLRTKNASVPSKGNLRVPVFMVGFNNYGFGSNQHDGQTMRVNYDITQGDGNNPLGGGDPYRAFEILFNGNSYIPDDNPGDGYMTVKDYYRNASYGQLNLQFNLATYSPVRASQSHTAYGDQNGEGPTFDLVHEAISKSLPGNLGNPSQYDSDGDGFIDGVVIMHAGPGASQQGDGQYVWPRRNSIEYNSNPEKGIVVVNNSNTQIKYVYNNNGQREYRNPRIYDLEKRPGGGLQLKNDPSNWPAQVWVYSDYCIQSESQFYWDDNGDKKQSMVGIGNIVHEFGHLLGMPDIYHKEKFTLGVWDIMAGGAWVAGQYFPTDFSVYTKAALGWITPQELYKDDDGTYTLPPSTDNKSNYYQINTRYGQDYFILENRVKKKNDLFIPAEGMLIWHLQERLADISNRYNYTPNGAPGFDFDGVDIEEADGTQDGDTQDTDTWPGLLGKTEFGPNTIPNSNSNYEGKPETGVRIYDIKELADGSIEFKLQHDETEDQEPKYCQTKSQFGNELGISQVTFGQLNNPSPWKGTYHYDAYQEAVVDKSDELELEIFVDGKIKQDYQDIDTEIGVKAFIDWNADGDFNDNGETVLAEAALLKDKKRYTTKITVPANLKHGSKRYLRVVTYSLNYTYNDWTYTLDDVEACGLSTKFKEGEAEDYRIVFMDENQVDVPSKPTNLQAFKVAENVEQARLTWEDNTDGEIRFDIYATDFTGLRYEKIDEAPANTTEKILNNLIPGNTYYFKVQAIVDPINSPLSDAAELTLDKGEPKDYYWVENGGEWGDLSHWATASGGSVKHERMPSRHDNIIFDENSFTKTQQSIIFTENFEAANIDMMKVTNRPEFTVVDENLAITVYGDLKIPKNVFGKWGKLYLKSENTVDDPAELIFESDEIFYEKVFFDAPSETGAWKLAGDFYGQIGILNKGILSFGDHYMRMFQEFQVSKTTNKKTLNLDDGEIETGYWNLPGYWDNPEALTFTQKNSTITVSTYELPQPGSIYQHDSRFNGGDRTYNRVAFKTSDLRLSIDYDEVRPILLYGNNTYNELKFHPGAIVSIGGGSAQTFEKITAIGVPEKPIKFLGQSKVDFINTGPNQVHVNYCHIKSINAVDQYDPNRCFKATNSVTLDTNWNWCTLLRENYLTVYPRYHRDIYVDDIIEDISSTDTENIDGVLEPKGLFRQNAITGGDLHFKIIEGNDFARLEGRKLIAEAPGLVRISVHSEGRGYGPSDPFNDLYVVILDRNQPNKFINFMEAKHVIGDDNFCIDGANNYPNGPEPSRSKTPIPTSVKVSTGGLVAVAAQNANRVMIWKRGPGVDNNNPALGDADYILGQKKWNEDRIPSVQDFGTYTNGPGNIAFSRDGNMLAVADRGGNRVLIYKNIYKAMEKADQRKANGEDPYITVEDADIVLGRSSFGLAQDYEIDKYPTGPAVFNDPHGMAFTEDGKFIVCDAGNNRVLIWNDVPEDHFMDADIVVGQPNMYSDQSGTTATTLWTPSSVAITRDGKMVIADPGNTRVLIYNRVPTSNGAKADIVLGQKSFFDRSWGISNREFSWPYGVAIDSENRLAISEYGNNRIVIYNDLPTTNYAPFDVVLGQPDFYTNKKYEDLSKDGLSSCSTYGKNGLSYQKRIILDPFEPSFDAAGRLYAAGWKSSQVKVYGAEAYKGDLRIEMETDNAKPAIGEEFNVTLKLTHVSGDHDAHNVRVNFILDQGLELVEAPTASSGDYDTELNQWRFDVLAKNANETLNVKVRLREGSENEEICMNANIISSLLDTNPDDNKAQICLNYKERIDIIVEDRINRTYCDPHSFNVYAETVPANLPIRYELQFQGEPTAEIKGNRVTILKPGSFSIRYIFEGTDRFKEKETSTLVAIDKCSLDIVMKWPQNGKTYSRGTSKKIEYAIANKLPDEFKDIDIKVIPDNWDAANLAAAEFDPETEILTFKQTSNHLCLRWKLQEQTIRDLAPYFKIDRTYFDTCVEVINGEVKERKIVFEPAMQTTYNSLDDIVFTGKTTPVYDYWSLTYTRDGSNIPSVVEDNTVSYKILQGEGEIVPTGNTYNVRIPQANGNAKIPEFKITGLKPGKYVIEATSEFIYVDGVPHEGAIELIEFEILREDLDKTAIITDFNIPDFQIGDEKIDQDAGTITVDVTSDFIGKFIPEITWEGNTIESSIGIQVDASSSNVVYTVTADDDDITKDYEIIINREPRCKIVVESINVEGIDYPVDSENTFVAAVVSSDIDLSNLRIFVNVPNQYLDVATITPTPSKHDFTKGFVDFVVGSKECNETTTYKVTVTHDQPDAAEILSADVNGVATVIAGNQIGVTLPAGSDLSNVIFENVIWKKPNKNPEITSHTDIGDGKYQITLDGNNQAIIKTQAGNKKVNYTLTVFVATEEGNPEITAFSLTDQASSSVNQATSTIDIIMPHGSDISNLEIESIILADPSSTTSLMVGNTYDFTNGHTLTVTATGDVQKVYTINVTIEEDTRSVAKDIISYTIDGIAGTVDANAKTVTVELPYSSAVDLSAVMPTIIISDLATISPEDQTVVDFSAGSIIYTVTAENESTQEWTVTVTKATDERSVAKDIISYTVDGIAGTVDANAKTVTVELPYSSAVDLSAVTPTITISDLATISPADQTVVDFSTGSVVYTVTAENESSQEWTVTVTKATDERSVAKDIISYTVDGIAGTVDANAKTVTVELPYSSAVDLSAVTPTITISDLATISPADQTVVDFSTGSVVYTVTAENESSQDWTVTVTKAADGRSVAKDIISYTVDGIAGTVDANAKTVTVELPYSSAVDLSAVTPTITISDLATISPADQTVVDFSAGSVIYTVTAENESSQEWTVTVTKATDERSVAKDIISYTVDGIAGTVDANAKTVTVELPYSSAVDLSAVTPTITISDLATISPADQTVVDFSTGSVVYTVTAENESSQEWTVTVTKATDERSVAKNIISYTVDGIAGTVDANAKTVTLELPYSSTVDLSAVTPTITISDLATISPADQTVVDFSTGSVVYTVTAENESSQDWTVTVYKKERITPTLTVSPSPISVIVGQTVDLNIETESTGTIHYEFEDATLAEIEGQNTLKGLKIGNTQMTIQIDETDDYLSTSISVEVNVIEAPKDARILSVEFYNEVSATINEDAKAIQVELYSFVELSNVSIKSILLTSGAELIAPSDINTIDFSNGVVDFIVKNGSTENIYKVKASNRPIIGLEIDEVAMTGQISSTFDGDRTFDVVISDSEFLSSIAVEDIKFKGSSVVFERSHPRIGQLWDYSNDGKLTIYNELGEQATYFINVRYAEDNSGNSDINIGGIEVNDESATVDNSDRTINVTLPEDEAGTVTITSIDLPDGVELVSPTLGTEVKYVPGKGGVDVVLRNQDGESVVYKLLVNGDDLQTGLGEFDEIELKVYPNPSAGRFSIDFGKHLDANIRVIDVAGAELYRSEASDSYIKMNLSHLPAGAYHVIVSDSYGNSETVKIIIVK
ncbi:DUF5018 domain-containing protein [Aureibacter tunicatorum]|uniref:M6 family metalloprotease-like protein n=1 Tax=Aureibacter tunicatorum TaxID=866807 RepID=A0AAE3XPP6_9BACT|nr:M6 family metalloprotease domain-containing protein [Aureibacter tunicatorum]MDR6239671.1 M6 family metalloprotease-like protein [Aureibacter tunicatorum]BDD04147.1 hypothetical protein AUTU_16300 [Aureibacter tunicatorum]